MMSCLPADWMIFVTNVLWKTPYFPFFIDYYKSVISKSDNLNVATNKSLKFF